LVRLAEVGDEAAAKERLAMIRGAPSVTGADEGLVMPDKLAEWGCDEELWAAVRSKAALVKLVEAGDEEQARQRLALVREKAATAEAKAKAKAEVRTEARAEAKTAAKPKRDASVQETPGNKAATGGYKLKGALPEGFDTIAVEALLARRVEAKKARDFETADALQEEITALGVYLNDNEHWWRVGKTRKASADDYKLEGTLPEGFDAAPVEALLARRVDAKKARDFETADALQKEVLALGVYLNDDARSWRPNKPKSAQD